MVLKSFELKEGRKASTIVMSFTGDIMCLSPLLNILSDDTRKAKVWNLGEFIWVGQENIPGRQVHVDDALCLQVNHGTGYL